MVSSTQIKPGTVVVCSKNARLATVDHMEGTDSIKLKKDEFGKHHYIPLSWVTKVDDKVHLSKPATVVRRDWTTAPVGKPLTFVAAKKIDKASAQASQTANDRATNEGMKTDAVRN